MYLDGLVQLHERVEVFYNVSPGYTATLYTADGDEEVSSADGETILGAVVALNEEVIRMNLTFTEVRDRRGKQNGTHG